MCSIILHLIIKTNKIELFSHPRGHSSISVKKFLKKLFSERIPEEMFLQESGAYIRCAVLLSARLDGISRSFSLCRYCAHSALYLSTIFL